MVRWNMAGMFPFFVGWISMKSSIDFWDFPAMVPGGWTCISGVARGTGGVVQLVGRLLVRTSLTCKHRPTNI